MAEKLCTLRTKGGGGGGATLVETVLWQNPSPSSNFGGQTITLSEDMNNYDYLGISWAYSTSNQSGNGINKLIMSVPDFKKVAYTSTAGTYPAVGTFTGTYSYVRNLIRSSDTTIYVGNCYQMSTSTQANGNSIPIQVVGIKKSGSGTKAKTVHGTGTMSTSTTTKVSLNFRPDFVVLECTKGTAEVRLVYDSAYGSSIQRLCAVTSAGTASYSKDSYPPTSTIGTRVSLIENDGFTISKLSQGNYDNYGADFAYIAGKYEV